ncbi:MAG TPA: cytochrome d ubiquinol oxidase subunit II [Planctomycetaceae bacterium]|jgi:cytochrome d ubiquinol oxidase subunit II
MEAIWFTIVSAMLALYVVLDGFDFGVGVVHKYVARTDAERRTVLAAIGPVWDGNEVWLIAAGGVLFMAFPRTYATTFSGFYLALMIVLWLLILRGVSMEFRSHQSNPLWREFWDTVFSFASVLLAIVFGTSLGNLVRGVPLGAEGLAGMPLFTNFLPGKNPGIFDWYTTLVGLFTLAVLAGHGALFLVWRTTGPVQARSQICANVAWRAVAALWVVVTLATFWLQREVFSNLVARPWSLLFVASSFRGLWGVFHYPKAGRELAAFLSSTAFLLGLIAATMIGNYPYWLRSTIDSSFSLTATNTASARYGLQVALAWWGLGFILAAGYFWYLYRSLRGKIEVGSDSGY